MSEQGLVASCEAKESFMKHVCDKLGKAVQILENCDPELVRDEEVISSQIEYISTLRQYLHGGYQKMKEWDDPSVSYSANVQMTMDFGNESLSGIFIPYPSWYGDLHSQRNHHYTLPARRNRMKRKSFSPRRDLRPKTLEPRSLFPDEKNFSGNSTKSHVALLESDGIELTISNSMERIRNSISEFNEFLVKYKGITTDGKPRDTVIGLDGDKEKEKSIQSTNKEGSGDFSKIQSMVQQLRPSQSSSYPATGMSTSPIPSVLDPIETALLAAIPPFPSVRKEFTKLRSESQPKDEDFIRALPVSDDQIFGTESLTGSRFRASDYEKETKSSVRPPATELRRTPKSTCIPRTRRTSSN